MTLPKPKSAVPAKRREASALALTQTPRMKRSAAAELGPDGKLIGAETSFASRKRRMPRLTREKILFSEDQDDDIEQFAPSFGINSPSNDTWGINSDGPIMATKRRRYGSRFKKAALGRGASLEDPFAQDSQKQVQHPNGPEYSPLLMVSLEVRERIYNYLLKSQRSIIVAEDWLKVERSPLQNHAVVQTCKQISEECTNFIYKNNEFHALLRTTNPNRLACVEPAFIDAKYISLFRYTIIECPANNWDFSWYEKAASAVEKLVEARAFLVSLTFIVTPQRVSHSTTAIGLEANPIAFSNFFWFPGRLMKAVQSLNCQILNVVIKKQGKRFAISVDTKFLPKEETAIASGLRTDPVFLKSIMEKENRTVEELAKLMERFEEIFQDDEKAVLEGKCRLLNNAEDSTSIGGLARKK